MLAFILQNQEQDQTKQELQQLLQIKRSLPSAGPADAGSWEGPD